MPKVSVIIPVYNTEKYLEKCLDSVVNQTLKDIEIILVDDGSTDNSSAILDKYKEIDKRITVIKQENSGAAIARNNAIEIATGDFLYFMDSDDYVDYAILEKLYNQAIKTNSEICVCSRINYDEGKNESAVCYEAIRIDMLPKNFQTFNYENLKDKIFLFCGIAIFTKIYKRELIINNNIQFQDVKTCNDVFFNFAAIACANQISYVNEPLVTSTRGRIGSLTADRGKKINNIITAGNALKEFLEEKNIFKKYKKTFYLRMIKQFIFELQRCHDNAIKKQFIKNAKDFLPLNYKLRFLIALINESQNLFSIKDEFYNNKYHTAICIFGIKLKIKRK